MVLEQYKKNREIVRQTLDDVRVVNAQIEAANIDAALDYFERVSDHETVVAKLKDRYAFSLKRIDQGDNSTQDDPGEYETYINATTGEIIEQSAEHVSVGIGNRIVNALADLYTNPTSYFEWIQGEDGQSAEEVEELVTEQRLAGGFDNQIANADYISCAVESGPLFVDFAAGNLGYRAFSPACLFAQYGDYVLENGERRAVDYTNPDDAICLVIQLSDGTEYESNVRSDEKEFLAIFGRSDVYDYGRYVTYRANKWYQWPDVGDSRATDWTTASGDVANPLTWYCDNINPESTVEYPVIVLRGGLTMTSNRLAPISTSLFSSCLEVDAAASRILHTSLLSARGTNALTNEMGSPLPHTTEGNIVLQNGQTISVMGQPVANSVGALEVVVKLSRAIAEGYNVAGYHVLSETGPAESGVALYIRSQPMIAHREKRVNLNRSAMDRLWNIERGLYEVYTGTPLASPDVVQAWHAGRYIMPESPTDKVTRIKAALDAGFVDYAKAVMEMHDLPNIAAAKKLIDEMEERKAEYPGPTQGQQGGLQGMIGKLQTRAPRGAKKSPVEQPEEQEEKK